MKRKALVILSGGQDSTTCLFWACKVFDEVHSVTFDYGQRHRREIAAATHIARLADVDSHEIISVPDVLRSTSPLVSDAAELERYTSFEQMDQVIGDRVELTFVPMRNALFLTLAANRAVVLGSEDLVTGICQADNANYPDCRDAFRLAMQEAIRLALGVEDFRVHAPLLTNSKAQTVQLAKELGIACMAALAFSHTSYAGEYPPTDANHANVLRAHGFEEADEPDPLVLRAALLERKMELPTTRNYRPTKIDDATALLDTLRRM